MINECFAAIYHDKVKDGPMRGRPAPSKKNNPSREGVVSQPTWRSVYNALDVKIDDEINIL